MPERTPDPGPGGPSSPEPTPEPLPVPSPEPMSVPSPEPLPFTRRHPTLVYTLSRVLLFLVVLGVLYLVGARDVVLLLLAFLVSGAISLVLLSRQRDAMSSSVSGTFRRINERIEASSRAEDDDDDDVPGGHEADDVPPPPATST